MGIWGLIDVWKHIWTWWEFKKLTKNKGKKDTNTSSWYQKLKKSLHQYNHYFAQSNCHKLTKYDFRRQKVTFCIQENLKNGFWGMGNSMLFRTALNHAVFLARIYMHHISPHCMDKGWILKVIKTKTHLHSTLAFN